MENRFAVIYSVYFESVNQIYHKYEYDMEKFIDSHINNKIVTCVSLFNTLKDATEFYNIVPKNYPFRKIDSEEYYNVIFIYDREAKTHIISHEYSYMHINDFKINN